MVWHKIQVLYQDLQLRYANGFLKLDDVLHHRGITLQRQEQLLVSDFVLYLQVYWEELTDPKVIHALDHQLRRRWNQPDIYPGYDPEKHTAIDEYIFRVELMKTGATNFGHAPGLKDISTLSPIDIVNHVYTKNGIILDCEKHVEEQHRMVRHATRMHIKHSSSSRNATPPDHPRSFPCKCGASCVCRDLCTVEPDGGCLCEMMPEFYDAYELDMLADAALSSKYDGACVGEHVLYGAQSNEFAQLHVATAALAQDARHRLAAIRATRDVANAVRRLEWKWITDAFGTPEETGTAESPRTTRSSTARATSATPSPRGKADLNKPLPPTPTPVPGRKRLNLGSLRGLGKKAKKL